MCISVWRSDVFSSYLYFPPESPVRIASARAGNVIGGGDWSVDRIVPDCVKAWSKGDVVELRHPEATRPWQHVLEPLGGYLCLAKALDDKKEFHRTEEHRVGKEGVSQSRSGGGG